MGRKSVRIFYHGKSILQILIARLSILPFPIIVTTSPQSPKTIQQATDAGVKVEIGEEGNVLARFAEVVEKYQLSGVFRVCADNPFIQLPLMYPVAVWAEHHDYVAFQDCMQRHEGFWIEYISAKAIYYADKILGEKHPYREHVSYYIYKSPHLFDVKWLPIPEELERYPIRLTVDTHSDFYIARKIYKYIGNQHWFNILGYILMNAPIQLQMKKNMEENEK
jgi:spore coat polysaccharide biosynthesis protein SpsF